MCWSKFLEILIKNRSTQNIILVLKITIEFSIKFKYSGPAQKLQGEKIFCLKYVKYFQI